MVPVVTELNIMPQILSTQPVESDCTVGLSVFVAQGILSQSVEQVCPITVPALAVPEGLLDPVTLKAIEFGEETEISLIVSIKEIVFDGKS